MIGMFKNTDQGLSHILEKTNLSYTVDILKYLYLLSSEQVQALYWVNVLTSTCCSNTYVLFKLFLRLIVHRTGHLLVYYALEVLKQ